MFRTRRQPAYGACTYVAVTLTKSLATIMHASVQVLLVATVLVLVASGDSSYLHILYIATWPVEIGSLLMLPFARV